jgi:hypothetical protein
VLLYCRFVYVFEINQAWCNFVKFVAQFREAPSFPNVDRLSLTGNDETVYDIVNTQCSSSIKTSRSAENWSMYTMIIIFAFN